MLKSVSYSSLAIATTLRKMPVARARRRNPPGRKHAAPRSEAEAHTVTAQLSARWMPKRGEELVAPVLEVGCPAHVDAVERHRPAAGDPQLGEPTSLPSSPTVPGSISTSVMSLHGTRRSSAAPSRTAIPASSMTIVRGEANRLRPEAV